MNLIDYIPAVRREKEAVRNQITEIQNRVTEFQNQNLYLKQELQKRSWAGANVNRLTADWRTSLTTIDNDIRTQGISLRSRARDLSQNNPYVKKFLNVLKANIVGANGFSFQNYAYDNNGKLDKASNDAIESAWNRWSKSKYCSASGKLGLSAFCDLIVESLARDGEVFVSLDRVKTKANPFGITLRMIDPDWIDLNKNDRVSDNVIIRMGIEIDVNTRKPLAYWVAPPKTSIDVDGNIGSYEEVRIPADQILHIFDPERANQTRGVTWLAQSLITLKMLDGYEESTLVNARASSQKMGFIETEKDATETTYTGDSVDADGYQLSTFEAGIIEQLAKGQHFIPFDPKYPDAQYVDFVKQQLHKLSSAWGVAYSSISNDLGETSFSSGRIGLLEERELHMKRQRLIIEQFLEPLFSVWLETAIMSGQVRYSPSGDSLPIAKFDKFNQPVFKGRRWGWVDPLKDLQAKKLSIELGLESVSSILQENNIDISDQIQLLKTEKEAIEKAGLNGYIRITEQTTKGQGTEVVPQP